MTLLRVGLASALIITLSGCVGPFPTGIRTGWAKGNFEILATRPARDSQPTERLLRQETEKKALLLFTPEGPRSNYAIDSSYRYFIQIGDSEPQSLGFLYVSTEWTEQPRLSAAAALGDAGLWVGIFPPPFVYPRKPEETVAGRAHNFETGEHTAIVFSAKKILRRFKFLAVESGPGFYATPDGRSLRFWRNDGWWHLDLDDGSQKPEPNRLEETEPSHQMVRIPGTRFAIYFDLPSFTEKQESLHGESYAFYAETGLDDKTSVGHGTVDLKIEHGWHWSRNIRDREQLLRSHFNGGLPPDLVRTPHYVRYEQSFNRSPTRKVIIFISDFGGWPVEITLKLTGTVDRWSEVLSRFEQTLRVEDGGAPK